MLDLNKHIQATKLIKNIKKCKKKLEEIKIQKKRKISIYLNITL